MDLYKTHGLKCLPLESRVWALVKDHRPTDANLSPHWDATQVLIAHLLALRLTQRELYAIGSNGYSASRPCWVACGDLPPRIQALLDERRLPLHVEAVKDARQIEQPLRFVYALTDLQPLMPEGLSVRGIFEMELLQIANIAKLKSRLLMTLILLALDQTTGSQADSARVRTRLARLGKGMRRPDSSQARSWGIEHLLAQFLGSDDTKQVVADGERTTKISPPARIAATLTTETGPGLKPLQQGMVRWSICSASAAMERKAAMAAETKRSERVTLLESLAQRPQRDRPLANTRHVDAVAHLKKDFPNFEAVLELMVRHLQLQARLGAPLQLPPVLMQGPPGVGKTHFARRLAEVLGAELEIRDLSGTTAGFVITGNAPNWADSQPGCIARLLERLPDGRMPMVFFDELDKGRFGNFPADQALLTLLEPASAGRFRDEHLDLELDARPISYLLACNLITSIRPELLSRVQVIHVPPPELDQMRVIARSVDSELRRETPQMSQVFLPLSEAFINSLQVLSPRQIRSALMSTYARAGHRTQGQGNGVMVLPEDLPKGITSGPESAPSINGLMCVPSVWREH
jgi:ATP-dependent Lon protease